LSTSAAPPNQATSLESHMIHRIQLLPGQTLREMIETEGYSKSPEKLAVIPKQTNPGGAFIERIAEMECRDLLCGPERKVSLFSGRILQDFGGHVMILTKPIKIKRCSPPQDSL
jgi:hypothetical protein